MAWEMEQIGGCTLYRGDAREVLPLLAPVDTVLADPPYGIGLVRKRAVIGHGQRQTINRPGRYMHPDTPEYVKTVVVPLIRLCQTLAQCTVVTPGNRCLWLYPPAVDLGGFFSAGATGMGPWGFTCIQPILYYGRDPYQRKGLGCRPNSCGQIYPNDANAQAHPCAKPLPMMRWLVNRTSLPGENVLDPFMGSGTTGVACMELGRSFIGVELDAQLFDAACRRIEDAYAQPDFFLSTPARPQQLVLAGG
jgi:site-specific DNA-methyltransferase (adenine-specific)